MDPAAAAQFISLADLKSFPGQMLAVGVFAEISKRIWNEMPDWLNRIFILLGAMCVNFIASLAQQGLPIGGLAWSTLLLVVLINAFVIALTTMKSIELVAERKVREVARDLAASGIQVETTVAAHKRSRPPEKIEPAALAPLATEIKDEPAPPSVRQRADEPPPTPNKNRA